MSLSQAYTYGVLAYLFTADGQLSDDLKTPAGLMRRDTHNLIHKYELEHIDLDKEYQLIKDKKSTLSRARREAVIMIIESVKEFKAKQLEVSK